MPIQPQYLSVSFWWKCGKSQAAIPHGCEGSWRRKVKFCLRHKTLWPLLHSTKSSRMKPTSFYFSNDSLSFRILQNIFSAFFLLSPHLDNELLAAFLTRTCLHKEYEKKIQNHDCPRSRDPPTNLAQYKYWGTWDTNASHWACAVSWEVDLQTVFPLVSDQSRPKSKNGVSKNSVWFCISS